MHTSDKVFFVDNFLENISAVIFLLQNVVNEGFKHYPRFFLRKRVQLVQSEETGANLLVCLK
jgi:hypothetical protein